MDKVRIPLVAVTTELPGDALSLFGGRVRVKTFKARGPRTQQEVIRCLGRADGAVTLLTDPITETVLEACPNLRVVANCAVGVDNIDLRACARRGVTVTNTPGVLTEATADLTWALILATARRVVEGDRLMRAGRFKGWVPTFHLGMDLRGKTLGVVGMGRIGRAVARRAPAFGMRVAYADPKPLPESVASALGIEHLPLAELAARAHILTLHCPLDAGTHHLMDRDRLASMRPGSILVNTGRGPLVDEAALVESLRSGHLAAAGLDVYEHEPLMAPGLKDLPNAVLLPHIGSASRETREEMARMAVANCLAVLEGRAPNNPVAPPS